MKTIKSLRIHKADWEGSEDIWDSDVKFAKTIAPTLSGVERLEINRGDRKQMQNIAVSYAHVTYIDLAIFTPFLISLRLLSLAEFTVSQTRLAHLLAFGISSYITL